MSKDFDKFMDDYLNNDLDFGFTTVSEKEYKSVIQDAEKKNTTFAEDKKRLEELIVPLIMNLIKTSDQEYIYWPKRAEELKPKLKEIYEILRKE